MRPERVNKWPISMTDDDDDDDGDDDGDDDSIHGLCSTSVSHTRKTSL